MGSPGDCSRAFAMGGRPDQVPEVPGPGLLRLTGQRMKWHNVMEWTPEATNA
jgi:hypothetical protein